MENNFDKAMKEYNQSKPSKSESKEKICDHEYTIKSSGWKICVICRLCLRRILSQDLSSYLNRYSFDNTKKDYVVGIREKMSELMGMIVRESRVSKDTGELYYVEPPEAGLPPVSCLIIQRSFLKCVTITNYLMEASEKQ